MNFRDCCFPLSQNVSSELIEHNAESQKANQSVPYSRKIGEQESLIENKISDLKGSSMKKVFFPSLWWWRCCSDHGLHTPGAALLQLLVAQLDWMLESRCCALTLLAVVRSWACTFSCGTCAHQAAMQAEVAGEIRLWDNSCQTSRASHLCGSVHKAALGIVSYLQGRVWTSKLCPDPCGDRNATDGSCALSSVLLYFFHMGHFSLV